MTSPRAIRGAVGASPWELISFLWIKENRPSYTVLATFALQWLERQESSTLAET